MCKLIIFIFAKRNIKIETDLVKSDNVPTQYINKCAFYLLQQKVNKFVAANSMFKPNKIVHVSFSNIQPCRCSKKCYQKRKKKQNKTCYPI